MDGTDVMMVESFLLFKGNGALPPIIKRRCV
jgi:hypothetical protein